MKSIKKLFSLIALSALILGSIAPPAQAQESKSPLVKQMYNGNWPSDTEAQQLRDELYYNMAIQAYINMLPALNTIGMREYFLKSWRSSVTTSFPSRARRCANVRRTSRRS